MIQTAIELGREYLFSLPKGGKRARRLYVVFNVPRGSPPPLPAGTKLCDGVRVGQAGLKADANGQLRDFAERNPNVLVLDLDPDVLFAKPADTLPPVRLQCRTEKLQQVKLVFEMEDGSLDTLWPAGKPPGAKAPKAGGAPPATATDLEQSLGLVNPETFLLELDQALQPGAAGAKGAGQKKAGGAADKVRRYQAFFADVDRRTAPHLVSVFQRLHDAGKIKTAIPAFAPTRTLVEMTRAAVANLMLGLLDFLSSRMGQPGMGVVPGSNAAHVGSFGSDANVIGALYLALVRHHFPAKQNPPGIDFDAYDEAFEMFSLGELRMQLRSGAWTGEPSSGYFFLFAELALLTALSSNETNAWVRLANVMVRCQPFFGRVYAPATTVNVPGLFDYGADNYKRDVAQRFRKDGLPDDARVEFQDYTFADLVRESAHNADDFLPALRATNPSA